jgi:hypothetical protein
MSRAVVFGVLCGSALGGCLIGDDGGGPACDHVPASVDPDGALTGYVVDRLDLPSNSTEVADLGLDLDGWANGGDSVVDNSLGAVIAVFASFDYDVDAEANALITSGSLLHLFELQATSTTDARGAGMRIGLGLDLDGDATDNFTGTEPLEFDPAHGSGRVTGDIVDGTFHFAIGETRIGVAFPGMDEPFVLPLIEVQVDGTITPTEITGRLAGGVPAPFIDDTMLPVLYEGLSRVIERDCPDGTCVAGSSGELVLEYLDPNDDGTLTFAEMQADPLVQNILTPDLVLQDGQCGIDEGDALSLGVGFHAVRAEIQ